MCIENLKCNYSICTSKIRLLFDSGFELEGSNCFFLRNGDANSNNNSFIVLFFDMSNSSITLDETLYKNLHANICKDDLENILSCFYKQILQINRKTDFPSHEFLTFFNVRMDLTSRKVYCNEKEILLTPIEYSLLKELLKNPLTTYTREQLLNLVWGEDYLGETRTVDVHISCLRKKLGWKNIITTVHKIGYCLNSSFIDLNC